MGISKKEPKSSNGWIESGLHQKPFHHLSKKQRIEISKIQKEIISVAMRSALSKQVSPRLRCHLSRCTSNKTASLTSFGSESLNRCMFSSYAYADDFDSDEKTALVLGSSGVLGKTLTKHLSRNLGMSVIGADVVAGGENHESSLRAFIPMPTMGDKQVGLGEMTEALASGLCDVMGDKREINAIVCASGGWHNDAEAPTATSSDDDFIAGARSFGENIDSMMSANLYPVLAAGYAANRYMAEEG